MKTLMAALLVSFAAGSAFAFDQAQCDMEKAKCNGDKACEMKAMSMDVCNSMPNMPSSNNPAPATPVQ
ncbi:MAG: hypothetical protein JWM09_868 [Francisellaceae bacterium]|nr:hypothetical protein [Francisellaceae bacterium]